MTPATAEASVITKMTAAPMPPAVLVFLDTPRNGHSPRNWLKTTLLTREELIKMINKSLSMFFLLLSLYLLCLFIIKTFCAPGIRTVQAVVTAA